MGTEIGYGFVKMHEIGGFQKTSTVAEDFLGCPSEMRKNTAEPNLVALGRERTCIRSNPGLEECSLKSDCSALTSDMYGGMQGYTFQVQTYIADLLLVLLSRQQPRQYSMCASSGNVQLTGVCLYLDTVPVPHMSFQNSRQP
jgi:hypothetical protein